MARTNPAQASDASVMSAAAASVEHQTQDMLYLDEQQAMPESECGLMRVLPAPRRQTGTNDLKNGAPSQMAQPNPLTIEREHEQLPIENTYVEFCDGRDRHLRDKQLLSRHDQLKRRRTEQSMLVDRSTKKRPQYRRPVYETRMRGTQD